MKKHFRIIAALLASVMLMAFMLSGCGKSEPSAEDAKKYVDAAIKLICTGEYDKSVKFSDIEEGKETEARDAIIDEMLGDISSQYALSDEITEQFRAFIIDALAKCKYTVTDAVKTDDNGKTGYDVTVSVEPLKIFSGVEDQMTNIMVDLLSDTSVLSMTQDEVIEARGEYLTKLITDEANEDMSGYGISIILAQIKALDLPDDNKQAV